MPDINYVVSDEAPVMQLTNPPQSSAGSLSAGSSSSAIFALREEPENPIPFKAALEFLPKYFDGQNMPVSRFLNDCIYARNSIAAKERRYLFMMIRTRITGVAFDSLQDRDIHNLEDLLSHIKVTFTEHRNISQLNTSLATVAQRDSENVLDYGTRVGKILTSIIELIEEKNLEESARIMIRSVRETALENFIMGLKRELVMRVRVGQPNTLQEAINLARADEWEIEYEAGLSRKDPENKVSEKVIIESHQKFKQCPDVQNRFRPYHSNARVRKISEVRNGDNASHKSSKNRGGHNGRFEGGRAPTARSDIACSRCSKSECLQVTKERQNACFVCNDPGHYARECPIAKGTRSNCFKCGKPGHIAKNFFQGRNNHNANQCKFCKRSGHNYEECRKRLNKIEESRKNKDNTLNE